ncbi:Uncharacterized protein Rs2_38562 [Raphanus sativus]|nr:Uncharacterized protein Rs2_38562 [Raphanus sativus]
MVHSDFEAEGDVDFAPVEHLLERVPVERSPELPRKDIEVEDQDFPVDDSPLPGWDPCLDLVMGAVRAMNHIGLALVDSQRESRIWRFKAEKNANDLARLQEETLERNLRVAANHAREIRRARRQAKREIAAEMQNRATRFQEEYYNLRAADAAVGNFKCRGSVGALTRTQQRDYVYKEELSLMQGGMKDNVHAESLVTPIEERIWGLWEPIPVSPDTVEVVT